MLGIYFCRLLPFYKSCSFLSLILLSFFKILTNIFKHSKLILNFSNPKVQNLVKSKPFTNHSYSVIWQHFWNLAFAMMVVLLILQYENEEFLTKIVNDFIYFPGEESKMSMNNWDVPIPLCDCWLQIQDAGSTLVCEDAQF